MTRAELIDALGRTREGRSHRGKNQLPWAANDPLTPVPAMTANRHSVLTALHDQLQPRTYLEVGVDRGKSMTLSRTRSIGVDPAFHVDHEIHCEVDLFRQTSDDFFADPANLSGFGGVPIDLAFIDGMHLAEFALRDFMNVEKHMALTGVVVLDDMLPRTSLSAYRTRRTGAWTGDVYKVHRVLERYRPDLTLVPLNAAPTGSYLVVGLDPESTVLDENYAEIEAELVSADPQTVPQEWLERRPARDPEPVLELDVWRGLRRVRESTTTRSDLEPLWDELRTVPTLGT